jgi:hypothetical protein
MKNHVLRLMPSLSFEWNSGMRDFFSLIGSVGRLWRDLHFVKFWEKYSSRRRVYSCVFLLDCIISSSSLDLSKLLSLLRSYSLRKTCRFVAAFISSRQVLYLTIKDDERNRIFDATVDSGKRRQERSLLLRDKSFKRLTQHSTKRWHDNQRDNKTFLILHYFYQLFCRQDIPSECHVIFGLLSLLQV